MPLRTPWNTGTNGLIYVVDRVLHLLMAANDNFRFALISHAHDFTNNEPSDTLSRVLTIRTANYSGTSSDPKIIYVAGAAGPANLTSLNGIAKASITNVNTIALGSITSINGVS